MKLLFTFTLLLATSLFTFSQKAKGLVGYGKKYSIENRFTVGKESNQNQKDTGPDTLNTEFSIAINTVKKFISIEGIDDIPINYFSFDSVEVDDIIEQYKEFDMADYWKGKGFTELRKFKFDMPIEVKKNKAGETVTIAYAHLYYHQTEHLVMMEISYVVNGTNYNYVFKFDDVVHFGWEYGLTFSRKFDVDYELSYENSKEESSDKNKFLGEGEVDISFEINDTSIIRTIDDNVTYAHLTNLIFRGDHHFIFAKGLAFKIPVELNKEKYFVKYFNYDDENRMFINYNVYTIKEEQ